MPEGVPGKGRGINEHIKLRRGCMAAQTNFIDIATIWLHAGKGGDGAARYNSAN